MVRPAFEAIRDDYPHGTLPWAEKKFGGSKRPRPVPAHQAMVVGRVELRPSPVLPRGRFGDEGGRSEDQSIDPNFNRRKR